MCIPQWDSRLSQSDCRSEITWPIEEEKHVTIRCHWDATAASNPLKVSQVEPPWVKRNISNFMVPYRISKQRVPVLENSLRLKGNGLNNLQLIREFVSHDTQRPLGKIAWCEDIVT